MNVSKPLPKTPKEHKEETYNKLAAKETPKHRNQGVKEAYNKLTESSKHPRKTEARRSKTLTTS